MVACKPSTSDASRSRRLRFGTWITCASTICSTAAARRAWTWIRHRRDVEAARARRVRGVHPLAGVADIITPTGGTVDLEPILVELRSASAATYAAACMRRPRSSGSTSKTRSCRPALPRHRRRARARARPCRTASRSRQHREQRLRGLAGRCVGRLSWTWLWTAEYVGDRYSTVPGSTSEGDRQPAALHARATVHGHDRDAFADGLSGIEGVYTSAATGRPEHGRSRERHAARCRLR